MKPLRKDYEYVGGLFPDELYLDPESLDPRDPNEDVSCCELACYEDEGCACEGCDALFSPEENDDDCPD